jgi:ureidoglycolate lyase
MTTTSILRLRPVPLTRALFTPFGDVIETDGNAHYTINDGHAERYSDLASIDVGEREGQIRLNIFQALPRALPMPIRMVERHPLSSQAFVAMGGQPFLVVVAAPGKAPLASDLHAFATNGRQGVNYARGVWHHPLIAFGSPGEFLVIDRGGPGENCDEAFFGEGEITLEAPTV